LDQFFLIFLKNEFLDNVKMFIILYLKTRVRLYMLNFCVKLKKELEFASRIECSALLQQPGSFS
jgi:hypothetical protein